MNKNQILEEVVNSTWQPEFEFTDDLDAVVDSILKPHEDYFLGLHSKVKEIIEREIEYATHINNTQQYQKHNFEASVMKHFAKPIESYQITFGDVCNWQKELFEYKKDKIKNIFAYSGYSKDEKVTELLIKINNLPNQHINLGLRQINVKVDNWTLPAPMFLEDLKEMCFPIGIGELNDYRRLIIGNSNWICTNDDSANFHLTYWYQIFETIHFFEDLNGRLGGIIINILSYILTGKYLINKQTYSYE